MMGFCRVPKPTWILFDTLTLPYCCYSIIASLEINGVPMSLFPSTFELATVLCFINVICFTPDLWPYVSSSRALGHLVL
jgi:hypothetical protein